uniref:Uncharacterized protein n=1 Tax=Anopheles atroparvus TaxID=41427 RepID=A0A182J318_ANOAO
MVNSSTTANGGQAAFQANPPPLASLFPGGPMQMAPVGSAFAANSNQPQPRLSYCTPPPLAHISAPEPPTQIPATVTALADTTTTHINEKGVVEQVVVKDGEVFYISFVDEPLPAETQSVPYESDTLPSIATELSQLLDSTSFHQYGSGVTAYRGIGRGACMRKLLYK